MIMMWKEKYFKHFFFSVQFGRGLVLQALIKRYNHVSEEEDGNNRLWLVANEGGHNELIETKNKMINENDNDDSSGS